MNTLYHRLVLLTIIVLICYTAIISSNDLPARRFQFTDDYTHTIEDGYNLYQVPKYHKHDHYTYGTYPTKQYEQVKLSEKEASQSDPDIEDALSVSYFSSIRDYITNIMKTIIPFSICISIIYIYMNIRGVIQAASNAVKDASESKVQVMNLLANYTQSSSNTILEPSTIPSNNETLNDTLHADQTSQPVPPPKKPKCKSFLASLLMDCVY